MNEDIEQNKQQDNEENAQSGLSVFILIAVAIVFVFILSILPWNSWTGGRLKDFSLISDLFPSLQKSEQISSPSTVNVDPLLTAVVENIDKAKSQDTTASAISADSIYNELVSTTQEVEFVTLDGGAVAIEDYSINGTGLTRFKKALENASNKLVRIAVIGDSYIEGDIFTEHVRSKLQDKYGGAGVGYMYADTESPGFRYSVRQTSSGWTTRDIRKSGVKHKTLAGEYFTGVPGAHTSFRGVKTTPHAGDWETSTILYVSPDAGNLTVSTANGSQTFSVVASNQVQALVIEENTHIFDLKSDINGLDILGIYLNNKTGVVVDCMPLRGNSGISHRSLDATLARNMAKWVDYDLIIIEYGINALSAQQKNYDAYGRLMTGVISQIRSCYPNADILLMGIGDRGEKYNGQVRSLSACPYMVKTQRNVAKATNCLFWDTRQSMGGENAIVDWRSTAHINADYIHLSHKGGERLAELFVCALINSLNKKEK